MVLVGIPAASCDTVDEDQTGFCLGVNVGIHLKSWNNQPITFTIFLLALPFFWGVCGSAYNPMTMLAFWHERLSAWLIMTAASKTGIVMLITMIIAFGRDTVSA